jgi:NADPH:quinone reductase-like Zn-dependent oxidoreductase
MRAWLMEYRKGIEALRFGEVADPEPGPGQVLLKVKCFKRRRKCERMGLHRQRKLW